MATHSSVLSWRIPGTGELLLLLNHISHVRLCATPETAAHQAPLSMGFARQEYWRGLPFPSPGEPRSPALQTDYLPTELLGKAPTLLLLLLSHISHVRLCATP